MSRLLGRDGAVPVVLSIAAAKIGADTRRCRHCRTDMYCRASGMSGGGACTDGPTGEGNSPTRLVIQVLGSSGLRPTDTPAQVEYCCTSHYAELLMQPTAYFGTMVDLNASLGKQPMGRI